MTNSPKSIEQLKTEAYIETRRKEQQLYNRLLDLEERHKADKENITFDLTKLWNEYHRKWMR